VADKYAIHDGGHFSAIVRLHRLDDIFSSLGLDRLDLVKIDVEGYEMEVLDGAASVLALHRPSVMLEMNHIALNLWRRISLPDFRDRLLSIFPAVFAGMDDVFVDFGDEVKGLSVMFAHLSKFHFMDTVAGFDRDELNSRLARHPEIKARNDARARNEPDAKALDAADAKAMRGLQGPCQDGQRALTIPLDHLCCRLRSAFDARHNKLDAW